MRQVPLFCDTVFLPPKICRMSIKKASLVGEAFFLIVVRLLVHHEADLHDLVGIRNLPFQGQPGSKRANGGVNPVTHGHQFCGSTHKHAEGLRQFSFPQALVYIICVIINEHYLSNNVNRHKHIYLLLVSSGSKKFSISSFRLSILSENLQILSEKLKK